jgi:hypothetical protein
MGWPHLSRKGRGQRCAPAQDRALHWHVVVALEEVLQDLHSRPGERGGARLDQAHAVAEVVEGEARVPAVGVVDAPVLDPAADRRLEADRL